MTGGVITVAVVEAVVLAHVQRAVEPHETRLALARHVDRAHPVARALAWAVARLASVAVVAGLAKTDSVLARAVAVAVHRARPRLACRAHKAGGAAAEAIETDSIATAIRWACLDRAVSVGEAWVAKTNAALAGTVSGAIVIACLRVHSDDQYYRKKQASAHDPYR